jgi:hypothetical protein
MSKLNIVLPNKNTADIYRLHIEFSLLMDIDVHSFRLHIFDEHTFPNTPTVVTLCPGGLLCLSDTGARFQRIIDTDIVLLHKALKCLLLQCFLTTNNSYFNVDFELNTLIPPL